MPLWPQWRLMRERRQGIYRVQGLCFQSQHSRNRLEMDIVNSSYATLRTLSDVNPTLFGFEPNGVGLTQPITVE